MIQGNCVLLKMPSNLFYCSNACGIDLGDRYVVTGGEFSLQTVARYSLAGDVTYMADLQQGRELHACTSFIDDNGDTVSLLINIIDI